MSFSSSSTSTLWSVVVDSFAGRVWSTGVLGTGREMQIVESSCSNDAEIIRISLELLLSPVVGIIINTHYYRKILREEALHNAR